MAVPRRALPNLSVPTKFVEINRDSALFGGKRFEIGQRIKVDELGQYVLDPSPNSEASSFLGSADRSSFGSFSTSALLNGSFTERGPSTGPITAPVGTTESLGSPSASTPARPVEGQTIGSTDPPTPPEDPAAQDVFTSGGSVPLEPPEVQPETTRTLRQQRNTPLEAPRRPASPGSSAKSRLHYSDIRDSRIQYKQLNDEIAVLQQHMLAQSATGAGAQGWIIVGRGAKYIPFAQDVAGKTKEDIIWSNSSKKPSETVFWCKVAGVCAALGLFCESASARSFAAYVTSVIPCVALKVSSAPGFAHYLGFLRPLARSDGFGSGVAEGFVPAVALSAMIYIALVLVNRKLTAVMWMPLTKLQTSRSKSTTSQ